MSNEIGLEFFLFVEHGREEEAAAFYTAAFGAQQIDAYRPDGVLMAVEMRFGTVSVSVAGSNPNREKAPSRGGPFFPKTAGAVSMIFRITVADIGSTVKRAIAAGATIRDEMQSDDAGRRVASVFDPFGHIWALMERRPEAASLAA